MLKSIVLVTAIIFNNAPQLSNSQVLQMAALIHKNAIEHRVDPTVLAAILAVESKFNIKAVNKKTGDLGIAQISPKNVKSLRINKARLTRDLNYSIASGASILGWFKANYKNDKLWYVRYNCGTRKNCTKTLKSKKYDKVVKRVIGKAAISLASL
jgi:soluble lytic murein transglycosylase-like protein